MFTRFLESDEERYLAENRVLCGGWGIYPTPGATTVQVTGADIERMQAGIARSDLATGAITTTRGNRKSQQKANSTCYYVVLATIAGTFKIYKGLDDVDRFPAEISDAMLDSELILSVFKVVTTTAWTVLEDNWGDATVTTCDLAGMLAVDLPSELTYAAATAPSSVEYSTDLTTDAGWTTQAGSPVFDGTFSGGVVYRDLGDGGGDDLDIYYAIDTAPVAAELIRIFFCSAVGPSYYEVRADASGWSILDSDSVELDAYAVPPEDAAAVRIKVIEGGDIEVYINGDLQMSTSDTAKRGGTLFSLFASGAAKIGIHPTEGALVVRSL